MPPPALSEGKQLAADGAENAVLDLVDGVCAHPELRGDVGRRAVLEDVRAEDGLRVGREGVAAQDAREGERPAFEHQLAVGVGRFGTGLALARLGDGGLGAGAAFALEAQDEASHDGEEVAAEAAAGAVVAEARQRAGDGEERLLHEVVAVRGAERAEVDALAGEPAPHDRTVEPREIVPARALRVGGDRAQERRRRDREGVRVHAADSSRNRPAPPAARGAA